jgi:small subunit ribosomal protein S20
MPITKSAKKALRVSKRKKTLNDNRKKTMQDEIKKVSKLVKTDKKSAQTELAKAYQAIDKAAKRGVIKKNTASRRKAKVAKMLK